MTKAGSFMHARRPCSPGRMTCKQGHTHYPGATYWTLMIYCLMTAHARPDHPAQHMFRWLRVTLPPLLHHLHRVLFQDRGVDRYHSSLHARSRSTVASLEPDGRPTRTSSAQDSTTGAARLPTQGPSSHMLAERLSRTARGLETRVPDSGVTGGSVHHAPVVHGLRASSPVRTLGRLLPVTCRQQPWLKHLVSPKLHCRLWTFDQQGTRITVCNFFPPTRIFHAA